MKVLTFGVFSCVIFIFSSVVSGTIITDTYGNEAYGNGTISWANPPAGIAYKTVNDYDAGKLALLFDTVRSFVNTVQSKPFPFGKQANYTLNIIRNKMLYIILYPLNHKLYRNSVDDRLVESCIEKT
jgi:hypothetical protein